MSVYCSFTHIIYLFPRLKLDVFTDTPGQVHDAVEGLEYSLSLSSMFWLQRVLPVMTAEEGLNHFVFCKRLFEHAVSYQQNT